ncbi:MAG: hypothetical protein D6707_01330, partial [Bacteroidetes bacterium]
MKLIFNIFFLTVLIGKISAQYFFDYSRAVKDTQTVFTYSFNLNVNGNELNNNFLHKVYKDGFAAPEDVREVYNRMPSVFSFGGDWNQHVFLSVPFSQNFVYRASLAIKVSDKQFFAGKLSKDVFGLFFLGNSNFLGQTIYAQNDDLKLITYQQAELGLNIDNGMGKKIGIYIGYLNANSYLQLQLNQSNFYTSVYGDTLKFHNEAAFFQTNPVSRFYENRGGGFSLSAFYQVDFFDYNSNKLNSSLTFQVSDLGQIKYYRVASSVAQKDILYTGLEIKDVFNYSSEYQNFTSDTLGFQTVYISKRIKLPTVFAVRYWQSYNSKFALNIQGYYRIQAYYKPLFTAEAQYKIHDMLTVKPSLGYGGWGTLQTGLLLSFRHSYIDLELGTYHAESWL